MFEYLLEQRWAVAAILSDRTVTKLADAQMLELTDENWQTLESMMPVQASLKRAATVVGGERGLGGHQDDRGVSRWAGRPANELM